MDLHLRGKRVLITGGSKGIGAASATLLAKEGCSLLLVARDPAQLATTADSIRARHQVQVETLSADLAQPSDQQRVADSAGPIDILVNNAGAIPPGSLTAVDMPTWRASWDLKVFGFIALTQALYPGLKTRKGVVVNVIGAAGELFDPGYIVGSSGNAALMAFTRALGRFAHRDGVRAVGINPGPVATERLERLMRHRAETELNDADRWMELCKPMPYGRPATSEEIANAVAFLASPCSAYTNGTIVTINGGP